MLPMFNDTVMLVFQTFDCVLFLSGPVLSIFVLVYIYSSLSHHPISLHYLPVFLSVPSIIFVSICILPESISLSLIRRPHHIVTYSIQKVYGLYITM